MSGPKVSIYDLTAEQRAIVLAQLQERLRMLEHVQEMVDHLNEALSDIRALKETVLKHTTIADELARASSDTSLQTRLQSIVAEADGLASQISAPTELDEAVLEKKVAATDAALSKLEGSAASLATEATKGAKRLMRALDRDISSLATEAEPAPQNDERADLKNEIQALLDNKVLPQNLHKELEELYGRLDEVDDSLLGSFASLELAPIRKRCAAYLELWDTCGEQYVRLIRRYECLASELGEDVEAVPFDKEAIEKLKGLISVMEEKLQSAAEKEYIYDTVSDVLTEMGYDLIGRRSVSKKNGTHFRNQLFQYSGDTAVNVTFSNNGQISMEIGKVAEDDRLPSPEEGRKLAENMVSFCQDFSEIERRLIARGVCIKGRIVLSPPSEEFAQIININDYEQEHHAAASEEQRRRSSSGRKTMALD